MPNEILPNRTGRLHPSRGRDAAEEEEELAPSPKLRGHVGLRDLMSRYGNETKKDKLLAARGKVSAP